MIHLCDLDIGIDNKGSDGLHFLYQLCYVEWYDKVFLYKQNGVLLVALDSLPSIKNKDSKKQILAEGHSVTLRNFITWMRSFSIDIDLVQCTNSTLSRTFEIPTTYEILYALKLVYTNSMHTDYLYHILCFMRFLTREFLPNGLPEDVSFRQLLSLIFSYQEYDVSHLPITGGLFTSPFSESYINGDPVPEKNLLLGRALFDFWSNLLKNNDWHTLRGEYLVSNIKNSVWRQFYTNWYQNSDTKDLDF